MNWGTILEKGPVLHLFLLKPAVTHPQSVMYCSSLEYLLTAGSDGCRLSSQITDIQERNRRGAVVWFFSVWVTGLCTCPLLSPNDWLLGFQISTLVRTRVEWQCAQPAGDTSNAQGFKPRPQLHGYTMVAREQSVPTPTWPLTQSHLFSTVHLEVCWLIGSLVPAGWSSSTFNSWKLSAVTVSLTRLYCRPVAYCLFVRTGFL